MSVYLYLWIKWKYHYEINFYVYIIFKVIPLFYKNTVANILKCTILKGYLSSTSKTIQIFDT